MHKGKNGFAENPLGDIPAREILNNINESLAIIDKKNNRILLTNTAFSNLTGYTAKQLVEKNLSEILDQKDLDLTSLEYNNDETVLDKRKSFNTHLRTKKGTKLEVSVTILKLSHNNSHDCVALVINKIDPSRELLEKKNILLSALTEINSRFISGAQHQTIFNELLSVLIRLTESEFGFIGEIKYTLKGKPYLKVHSFTNIAWTEELRKLYSQYQTCGLEFYNLNNLFGVAVTVGEPVISNDPAHDPRSKGTPPGHPPLKCFLGMPFKRGNKITGLVGVANRAGGYNEEIVKLLEPFIVSCASIIEAIRLETDRRKIEESLKNSLQLKDSLLRELHHRVKNNLQIIISLINLELSYRKENSHGKPLSNLRNRIRAISLVHELLYQSEDISIIDTKEYLTKLCENIKIAFKNKILKIKLEYHIESVHLDINTAINIGIIMNELISNSIIHAFPEDYEGTITINVFKTTKNNSLNNSNHGNHGNHSKHTNHNKILVINVSDTGIGFPETFNLESCSSLGFQLCKQLVASMNGAISISKSNQFNSIVSVIIPIANNRRGNHH